MALLKFEDLPSTATPLNAKNLNGNFNEVLNLIYPIGRVIIDETDTDYSNYLGFTWEQTLVGVVPVGKDAGQTEFNKLGKTGGEKTHKLTTQEMPSHSHTMYSPDGFRNSGTGSDWNNQGIKVNDLGTGRQTSSNGGNQAHNNLQPYKVVNYWKRIS